MGLGLGLGLGIRAGSSNNIVDPVPNKADLARRFKSLAEEVEGTVAKDEYGRDALVDLPVTELDGVSGSVLSDKLPIIGEYVEFTVYLPNIVNNTYFYGTNDGSSLHRFQIRIDPNGDVNYGFGTKVQAFTIAIDKSIIHTFKINVVSSSKIDCYIDDVLVYTETTFDVSTIPNTEKVAFGALYLSQSPSLHASCNMWDIYNFGEDIPLPHLGYGINAAGEAVELTVSPTGVSKSYDPKGSKYLLEKGVVERNPELNPIIDFTDGWVTTVGTTIIDNDTFETTQIGGIYKEFPIIMGKSYTLVSNSDYANLDIRNGTSGVSPQIGTGDGTFTFTATSVFIYLRTTEATIVNQSVLSIKLTDPDVIPNNLLGQPSVTLQEGDTFIGGGNFLNRSDFILDMSRPNGVESELVVDPNFPLGTANWVATGSSELGDGFGRLYSPDGSFASLRQSNVFNVGIKSLVILSILTGESSKAIKVVAGGTEKVVSANAGVKVLTLTPTTPTLDVARSLTSVDIKIDFVSVMPLAQAVEFFDKSRTDIWGPAVQASIYFDSDNPFKWHQSELAQEFIYANIQPAYKYQWWIKIVLDKYKDLFLYNTPLTGDDIQRAINYVGVPES